MTLSQEAESRTNEELRTTKKALALLMEQHATVTEEHLHTKERMMRLEEDKMNLLHALQEELDWVSSARDALEFWCDACCRRMTIWLSNL